MEKETIKTPENLQLLASLQHIGHYVTKVDSQMFSMNIDFSNYFDLTFSSLIIHSVIVLLDGTSGFHSQTLLVQINTTRCPLSSVYR